MNEAPHVLVVARYGDADDAGRILRCLSGQTYRETRLVFVRSNKKQETSAPGEAVEICSEGDFPAYLEKAGSERVLFWPDEGDLKQAAIEKLVLALQLAPDQDGVADAARGGTGLWLARNVEAMSSLIALWVKSQAQWIGECHTRKPGLFFIPENLIECSDPEALRRPYAVEDLFCKLPLCLKNYQQISTEPLWTLPAAETDERSILFLVSSLPMGGACKFILDISAQLKAQGYRVTVATTSYDSHNPNPWLDELLRIVPDVFVLSHSRPVELPRLVAHLARTRRCRRVVISHSMLAYQLLPWLRLQLPDVSFLDYTHIEYESEWPDGGYARRSVNYQSLLDMSMVSSEHLRQWMMERGAGEDGLRVCHTNIDAEKWAPDAQARARVRYELGIDPKTAMILYPCRVAEQKRPELMCNIVAALRRATKAPFVVCVAGDGHLMPALKTFIEKQGLKDSFRLLGAVSLERVAQLHNASDIFLLPSLIEGIALALFEAMALESVPVVSDVGGQSELVSPECGYLIPLGKAERELTAYVTVLKRLLENPERRLQMASACRARVRDHFRLEQMTTTFIAALNDADTRHGRPVQLPEASICLELATLAIDHVRVTHEGSVTWEMGCLLHDKMTKQEKIIAKLQHQIETARSVNLTREENAIAC